MALSYVHPGLESRIALELGNKNIQANIGAFGSSVFYFPAALSSQKLLITKI